MGKIGIVTGFLSILAYLTAIAAAEPDGVIPLKGQTETVYSVAFTPDGKQAATGSFDKSIKLWDAATGKELRTFGGPNGHQNLVLSVAISSDGTTLASGSQDNTAKLWDVPSNSPLRLMAHADAINALALSPDGKLLAGAGKDAAIRIWNTADGKPLLTFTGHSGPATGVAFSSDGKTLASCGSDRTIRLWNPADGKPLGVLTAHGSAVSAIAFQPGNPAILYSCGEDGALKYWKLPIAAPRQLAKLDGPITSLGFSATGNELLVASADKTARMFNFANGQQLRSVAAPAAVNAAALSPNGALIAMGTADHRLLFANAGDGAIIQQRLAHAGPVSGIAFQPQGGQLLTGGLDGYLKLWTLPPAPTRTLAHPDAVLAAMVSADGQRLITGGADKIVRSWNLANNQLERQFAAHTGPVTAVAASADGKQLVSGSADETIRFWNPANAQQTTLLGAHTGTVTSLAMSGNGQQLLSAGSDGMVKLWRLPIAPAKTLAHPDAVTAAALSPNGNLLLAGCADRSARLWNLATGQVAHTFSGNALAVTAIAFGANGARAVTGGADKTLIVWNTADGKEVRRFANLPAAVLAAAFHPDGATLAAGFADHSIRIYDLAAGKETRSLTGHAGPITGLAFTPRGDRLISASADKSVQVWNTANGVSQAKFPFAGAVTCLSLSKDGQRIAVGVDKTVQIASLDRRGPAPSIATPAAVRAVAFSSDSERLVVGGEDNRVRVYDAAGKLIEFFAHEKPISAVAFHPDGKQIVSASADKNARVSPVSVTWQHAQTGPVRQVAFHPNGMRAFSTGDDKQIHIWNVADGRQVETLAYQGTLSALSAHSAGQELVAQQIEKRLVLWNMAAPNEKPRIYPMAGSVTLGAFSPDGARLAVVGTEPGGPVVRLFDAKLGVEFAGVPQPPGAVHAIGFLKDNQTIYLAGADKSVRLIDLGLLAIASAHSGGVTSVAFAPNGTQIVSGGKDGTIKSWTTSGNKFAPAATIATFSEPVNAVVISRDGAQIAAAAGKSAKLWNAADGKEIMTLSHPAPVAALTFNGDRTRLATGGADGIARVWDIATGRELESFVHGSAIRAIAIHPNNLNVVVGGDDHRVAVYTLSATRMIAAAPAPLRALTVTPNGSHVITGGDDRLVRFWNTGTGAADRTLPGAQAPVTALAMARNNVLLAVGAGDRTVSLIAPNTDNQPLTTLRTPEAPRALAFSPNNLVLAAACADRSVATWAVPYNPGQPNPPDFGKPLQLTGHDAGATDVVFAPDNVFYYSSGLDNSVRVWKFASDAPTKSFAHPNLVDAVAFNRDGTQLATGCHDGILRIWDIAKAQPRAISAHIKPTPQPIYCVAWSPDGKQVVTGSLDNTLKLWDGGSGALVREFKAYKEKEFENGHREGVFCAAFSPDGKYLASGSSDRSIKIWNVADGSVVRTMVNPNIKPPANTLPGPPQAHPGWVYGVRFTPDGKHLVSVGNAPPKQGYLALWNVADGKLLSGDTSPLGPFYAVAVSPNGKLLALGCGTRGLETQDVHAYLMKTPPVK